MKILYGVQGTGNGHISRSREMAKSLKQKDADVQFLFSGRQKSLYFDMEEFGSYISYDGFTFSIKDGKVDYIDTIRQSNVSSFLRNIDNLDLSQYDLVISDYEPITAWAGKKFKIPVIGIGHQYAFNYDIPTTGFNWFSKQFMKQFAPVDIGIGLHWDNFGQSILPPIIDHTLSSKTTVDKKVVVYLPFENQNKIANVFSQFKDYQFYVFSNNPIEDKYENIKSFRLSLDQFKEHLKTCERVICNSGFELISECLHLGKHILTKPVDKQAEQMSNALAIRQLNYGMTTNTVDVNTLKEWFLRDNTPVQFKLTNISDVITSNIIVGNFNIKQMSDQCWSDVKIANK